MLFNPFIQSPVLNDVEHGRHLNPMSGPAFMGCMGMGKPAMNLEQHAALQPRIVDVQRLALHFAELGEMRISRLLMEAGMRAAKLRPVAPVATPAPQSKAKP